MNSIFALTIKKENGVWAFDYPELNIYKEPFVSGADSLLDKMANAYKRNPKKGLNVVFSDNYFPDHQLVLEKTNEFAHSGTWYLCKDMNNHRAWLCSCLNRFYPISPDKIYIKVV